jgi:UDP-glucuronate 4-epimerase
MPTALNRAPFFDPEVAMRFVVTGAAGFIGSHLCDRLISEGHGVIGIDNFSDYYPRWIKRDNVAGFAARSGLHLLEADLGEVDLAPLLQDVDGVFHLAGQPGVRLSWGAGFSAYIRDNVWVTQRLFESVRDRPVPVVCASSSSVYGDADRRLLHEDDALEPVSLYGLTKLAVEHLARIYREEHGLQVTCLRYFTVYGPRSRPDMAFSRFIRAGSSGAPVTVLGSGRQTRDFTFVSDVVDATIRALGAPGGCLQRRRWPAGLDSGRARLPA